MRISDWSSDVCSSDLVRDGKAVVTAEIQDDKAPLPAGTRGRIRWESVLGARTLEVLPGKKGNADLPSGSLLTGNVESAELRSEEHTSELQSLMRISYAVFCFHKKTKQTQSASHI